MGGCFQAINTVYLLVKTTLEFPDELFRSVKAKAAQEGISLKDYVAAALREKLRRSSDASGVKPWMRHFGALSHLRKETRRIEKRIEHEFETIDIDGWK
jgi:hypothetical protein